MEQVDRETIQRNIVLLSNMVDIDILYRELIQRGVIDHNFIERIKGKYRVGQEQAQEFFLSYTKRGPQAFQILIDSLEQIGHISEANLLRARQAQTLIYAENGHGGFSPTSNRGNSTSLPGSPLMRGHTSRVEPLSGGSGTNSLTSSSSSISALDHQLRRVSVSSNSFDDLPPLVISVKPAEIYNMGQADTTKAYQMMSKPRGYALIINNIEFLGDGRAKREGAEKDTTHLQKLLEQLGFLVMIRHNVKKDELINAETGILKKFLDQFYRGKSVDACVVAIMSHGKPGNFIRTHDAQHSDLRKNHWNFYDEILKKFNNRYCPILKGKPKIFILQACQGEERDRGVRRTCTDGKDLTTSLETASMTGSFESYSEQDELEDSPETEDMVVCCSTVPGYVSNRDIEHGTWYICTLCKVFMENAWNSEIFDLLRMVGQSMRELRSETSEKQMSSFTALGLHNQLYFNPGLYEDTGGRLDGT